MFDLLETFINVVEYGTLSEAAKKLHTNQPNITVRIQKLEKELGVKLFDREGKKLILNPVGYKMYEQFRALLKSYSDIRGEMELYKQPNYGHIRIGGGFQILLSILPGFLSYFSELLPKVTFDIKIGPADEIYQLVKNYDIDFGFVDTRQSTEGIEQLELGLQTRLELIVPKTSELSHLETVTKQDLYKMQFISFKKGTRLMNYIEHELEKEGILPNELSTKMELDHIELIIKMVEMGLGAAIVPITTTSQIIQNKDVKLLHVIDLNMTPQKIYLIYRKNRFFPASSLQFINEIGTYYKFSDL
ncbi:LysR substrate-binding domain-containing protein [Microbacteriaceae bacterium 4G12]